ncbi:PREDICTED: uncharacterized protein LOC104811249 [Tarenaya hassleriana]|uniref:uncharacterized protein LOC104811249 n=1 Tax=Tarenaya hassleriana TaxID=28532 RepID=UPI00053C94DB|nr:PREDICTED: uncharacterized protein LOC104811249 [Tarenaya hassleriana]
MPMVKFVTVIKKMFATLLFRVVNSCFYLLSGHVLMLSDFWVTLSFWGFPLLFIRFKVTSTSLKENIFLGFVRFEVQMPKKNSSSKKPLQSEEIPTMGHAKPVPKPGKLGKEIDEIFGGKKRRKPELEKSEKKTNRDAKQPNEENPVQKTKKTKRRKGEKIDGFGAPSKRQRKRTEDGLMVYTEDELGINKSNSGGTPLCPFDCDCCF